MVFLAALLIGAVLPLQAERWEPQPERRDLLALRVSGVRQLLVDAKDVGLLRALELLGPRLAELPAELGEDAQQLASVSSILERLSARPCELRFGVAPEAPVPVYAQLAVQEASDEAARAAGAELVSALEGLGVELGAPDARGLRALPSADLPAWLGVRGDELFVAFGDVVSQPLELGSGHLSAGTSPAVSLRLDIGGALEALETFGLAGPELAPVLEVYDWLGLSDARLSFELGIDGERAVAVSVVEGAVPDMRASGLLPEATIPMASLRVIPPDARWATVTVNNLGALVAMSRSLASEMTGPGGEDPLELLAAETGVHLERDVLAHLGACLGAYASDTTGGGGLSSLVLFAELADANALSRTLTRIEGRLNQLAKEEADGYAQIRVRMLEGRRVSTLTFPGLPVPLEPSWTTEGGFLFVGLTSGAVLAAARHVARGERSLLDVDAFREQLPEGPEGLYGLSYLDAPALLRDGYGWAGLACSALANALRSREVVAREPGVILPSFADLTRGAKAWVSATRAVGDDLVETVRMDRSLLVNATALAGLLDSMPLLTALPALAGLGAQRTAEAMAFAEELAAAAPADPAAQVREDLLAIHYACIEYALVNDGRYPDSLDELILPDEHGMRFLEHETVPVDPWRNEYYYEPPAEGSDGPRIWTLGRDQAAGGSGPDADLSSEQVILEMRGDR